MPGQRGRLRGDALHEVAVADDRVGGVVDDFESGAVVARGELRFGDRHAHGIGEALPERTGRDLHARRMPALGMPGRLAAPLAEVLDVVQREVVAGQVQQAVEQHRTVPGREHEPVAIEPVRIARIVLEQARPQHIGHRRGPERHARMAAVRLLHGIYRQETHSVDAQLIQFGRHDPS